MGAGAQLHFDWTLDEQERRVLNVLRQCVGKANAITVPQLSQCLGGVQPRQVQSIIRRLCVEHGEPILSGGAGVWIAASADELLASYREQRRKAISGLIRQRMVYRRHLARLQGQREIAECRLPIVDCGSVRPGQSAIVNPQSTIRGAGR